MTMNLNAPDLTKRPPRNPRAMLAGYVIAARFHRLRSAGYDDEFINEVPRVMEYHRACARYRDDIEYATATEWGAPERNRMLSHV